MIVVASLALLTGVNLPAFSQTTVTASTPVTLCVGSTQTLSPISIAEAPANPNGFSAPQTNATFILTAPSNFEFVSVGSVTNSGGDIVSTSIQSVSSTQLTILITISGVSSTDDSFQINDLMVKASSTGIPGDILRTGGSLIVAGGQADENNGVPYGSLTANPLPTLSGLSQPSSVCEGSGATIDLTGLVPGSTSTVDYSINGVAQIPATGIVANVGGSGSFLTANLLSANNGQLLQVTGITITSSSPNCSKAFGIGTLLVVNTPPNIVGFPADQVSCLGSSATFSVNAGVTSNPTYQWRKGGVNILLATSRL